MFLKINKSNQELLAKENGIVFFLSLDIQNSTKYKLSDPITWMFDFEYFFQKVREYFSQITNCFIWKELGDEIILVFFPKSIDDLKKILDIAIETSLNKNEYRKILTDINLNYKTTLFCTGYSEPEPFCILNSKKNRSDISKHNEFIKSGYSTHRNHRSIHLPNGPSDGQPSSCIIGSVKMYDFLGPDIDTGFRINKYSKAYTLNVSDKVAYLFSKLFPTSYGFKLNKKKKLKGVWNNKKYPIINYTQSNKGASFLEKIYIRNNKLVQMNNFVEKVKSELTQ
ncbi:MAG: hypothetical protein JW982_10520 [Spirochaetes bacterium]|nr:hypothetical protein [Spirochaetota bacterium]